MHGLGHLFLILKTEKNPIASHRYYSHFLLQLIILLGGERPGLRMQKNNLKIFHMSGNVIIFYLFPLSPFY